MEKAEKRFEKKGFFYSQFYLTPGFVMSFYVRRVPSLILKV